jgi:signal transduction histidine kinase
MIERDSGLTRSIARGLLVMTGVLNVAFLLGLSFTGSHSRFVGVWLAGATEVVPVVLFWFMAWRTRFARRDIVLIAAGVTATVIGDVSYSFAMDSNGDLPFPSPSDISYLLFYPLVFAGLVVLVVRHRRHRVVLTVVLDSLVAAIGADAVLAAILGTAMSAAASNPTFVASAVSLAYPVLDIALISAIAGIAAVPGIDIGPRWGLLLSGLFIMTAGDVIYAVLIGGSLYQAGTPLDATWAIGIGLMAWWAEQQDASIPRRTTADRPWRAFVVPLGAVVASLVVLLAGTQRPVPVYALVLAAITVFLAAAPVVLRQRMLAQIVSSQQRVVKDLTELDAAKTEMMTTLNHEIRTPLASIRGYLELVEEGAGGEIPDAAAELLRVASRNTDRLESLADDMLLLARLEARVTVSESLPVDIDELLREVAASLEAVALHRDVRLVAEGVPIRAVVSGDAAQLRRAFANITENAIKFTPADGTVRLITDAESQPDGSTAVCVRIIDTGIGVPSDEVEHLLTKFYRASNARSEAVPGSGLGLSIAHNLITAHHGELAVTSVIGVGTAVEVRLPAL